MIDNIIKVLVAIGLSIAVLTSALVLIRLSQVIIIDTDINKKIAERDTVIVTQQRLLRQYKEMK